jgi:hypothetical protein
VRVSEDEEKLVLATLDPLSAAAAWDKEKLDALLRDVSTGDVAVQQLLDNLAVKTGIVPEQDVNELWKGMPEFEQEDQMGYKQIIVHFATEDDYKAFANLINQPLTPNTKFIWYPEQEKVNLLAYKCEDEP